MRQRDWIFIMLFMAVLVQPTADSLVLGQGTRDIMVGSKTAPEKVLSTGIDFGRYHALVIGNENYQHLEKLKTAIDDAQAIAALLQNDYGFQVRTLVNAERDDIIEALDRLRAQLSVGDNLLIYYAGHGYLDQGADRGYWLPVDAREDTKTRWVSNTTITDTLKAINAKHVLVVADSCYSGTLTRGGEVQLKTQEDPVAYQVKMATRRSRTALTSGGLEPVLDGGGSGHSIFASALLGVLRDNSGVLEGQGVFEQIRRPILLNAEQQPKYSDIRYTGHEDGDFLFVRQGVSVDSPSQPPLIAKAPPYSAPQRLTKEITGKDGAPMVLIAGGEFLMGSLEGEGAADEHPRHQVSLDAFYLDKYEVTNRLFDQYVQTTDYRTITEMEETAYGFTTEGKWQQIKGAHWRQPEGEATVFVSDRQNHPVVFVSWEEANAYCQHYGKRLPTEAEWEYAARAGTLTKYWWGDGTPGSRRVANIADEALMRGLPDWRNTIMVGYDDGSVRTAPVGSYEPNPWGLYDMIGNVKEWVADWHGRHYYSQSPGYNPTGSSNGAFKVRRGGSWDDSPIDLRAAYRAWHTPVNRTGLIGIRCAQDAP